MIDDEPSRPASPPCNGPPPEGTNVCAPAARRRHRRKDRLEAVASSWLTCAQLVELVTDYLEGALSPADLRRFEEHTNGCPNCTRYLEQLRATIRICGTITTDDLAPEMERELLGVFRNWRS